ncbi:MAG: dihydroneopterin aldolase family protein [Desulfurococcaceae archaeon]
MSCSEDPAAKYFSSKVTPRDRAVFEAGIAIGTAVHQFSGIPLRTPQDLEVIREAVRRALLAQPCREYVEVEIEYEKPSRPPPYDYTTLKSRNMDLRIVVNYKGTRVKARLRYIPELDFTLGYIEDIEES